MCVGTHRYDTEEGVKSLQQELQMVVGYHVGPKFQSSSRAASTPNC